MSDIRERDEQAAYAAASHEPNVQDLLEAACPIEDLKELETKIVIISTRSLSKEELVCFNRNINLVEYNDDYHSHKSFHEMKFDILFINLRLKNHMHWYSLNQEDILKANLKVILLKKKGEHIRKQEEYKAHIVVKKINTKILDNVEEFIKNLIAPSLPRLEGRAKKIIRGLGKCIGISN